jgi:hypothetical protein
VIVQSVSVMIPVVVLVVAVVVTVDEVRATEVEVVLGGGLNAVGRVVCFVLEEDEIMDEDEMAVMGAEEGLEVDGKVVVAAELVTGAGAAV